jgi:hypothetical protein
MRHRGTFLVGLAAGLVAGMRLGRDRYEQVKKLGQKVIDNPSVQKATKAAGQKAGELTKAASHAAGDKLPKITETAKSSAGKVINQFSRNHDDDPVAVNGTGPSPRP